MAKSRRTIDYLNYGYEELRDALIESIRQTDSFKDINVEGSNIRTLVDLQAHIGSLFGYYINSAANEVFLPTAKRYNNLNKIAQLLQYEPRGVVSAKVDVIGSLDSEYVYGKEGQYIEIPAYSIFPSTRPTKDGENFIFTNPESYVHIVKGFGIRPLDQTDFQYKGNSLPIVANKSFFLEGTNNSPTIDLDKLSIPLNLYKNLSVITEDTQKLRPFDRDNYPLFNPLTDSPDVNKQPFDKTIFGESYPSAMVVGVDYPVLLQYEESTSQPRLIVVTDQVVLNDDEKNIIGNIRLELLDAELETYRLSLVDVVSNQRFYIGRTGMRNLESVRFTFDKIQGTDFIERINLNISEDGNSPPFICLIGGQVYSFNRGVIHSNRFKRDFFDKNVPYYNINLCLNNIDTPENNYASHLEVTTKEPLNNQITIARIYPRVIDIETGTQTVSTDPGKKYGNLNAIETQSAFSTEQKIGRVYFSKGDQVKRIIFNEAFEPINDEIKYQIQLSPEGNVRSWYVDPTPGGFEMWVEPNAEFVGYISWVATRVISENTKRIPVKFDKRLDAAVGLDGLSANYMIHLTPNQNVEVWYDNVTLDGFDIISEKSFEGRVSWSVYNFYDENSLDGDIASTYRQSGRIFLPKDQDNQDIQLEINLPSNNYAVQLVPNKNINLFYTDKSTSGFTINKEPNVGVDVIVDWYVDSSEDYMFQRHGEIVFSGRTTIEGSIPGLYLVNVPETFEINNLIQGRVGFTYVNINNVPDPRNNFLQINVDSSRVNEKSLRFVVRNRKISTNSVRVFVKNDDGVWDEWKRTSVSSNTNAGPGEKVFKVKVNPDRQTIIDFGDGDNWGSSVVDKELFIIGLESVGSEGNIGKNVLSPQVTISQYILGNDRTDIQFERSLVSVIGLKSKLIFEGSTPSTNLLDSENTRIDSRNLTIVQNMVSIGGADVETVDELRSNATNTMVRQNRNISTDDYERYMIEVFHNYFQKVRILTYDQFKSSGIISPTEMSKYWFNHIFIVGLNKDGSNVIPKSLRDTILKELNGMTNKMIGVEHEIVPAKWVPVDVAIRYKKNKFSNQSIIETEMRKNIVEFFLPENHELGEKINHSELIKIAKVDGVEAIEIMMNKDPNNEFTPNDYNVNVRYSGTDIEKEKRNKLLELVGKDPSLVKIFQPLFDTVDEQGVREWNYSLDISLSEFEFPKLGDIIIERE